MFGWLTLTLFGVLTTQRANERELIEALQRGDGRAWRQVMEDYGPMLVAYATRLLKSRAAAEEAVQEAVVSVHGGIERFEGRCSLKSWLFRAVHNKSIDELRRNKRFATPNRDEDAEWERRFGPRMWADPPKQWAGTVDAKIDAKRVLDVVRSEVENLPHTHRQVLLMKEVHGLSSKEVCDVLEISPANLRVSLHRARRALRNAVSQQLGEA
ncbi:MAG: RNA polymerase sigma factor [Myxococcales bacterium]|nr:RNA polymerase sigma factor [Myxococcales bacterium]